LRKSSALLVSLLLLAVSLFATAMPAGAVQVVFEVDATGDIIPLSQYVTIQRPDEKVSITGNQDSLRFWTPNDLFLSDDGLGHDAVAGDRIWTGLFKFAPGTAVQYRYTIGRHGDSWGGTEEFPLTARGFTPPDLDGLRMRIHDIFADRPDPSGTMGPNARINYEPTVPVPATLPLLVSGLASLGLWGFRRKAKR